MRIICLIPLFVVFVCLRVCPHRNAYSQSVAVLHRVSYSHASLVDDVTVVWNLGSQYVNWNKSRERGASFGIDGDIMNAIEGLCGIRHWIVCRILYSLGVIGFSKPLSVRILSEELGYNKVTGWIGRVDWGCKIVGHTYTLTYIQHVHSCCISVDVCHKCKSPYPPLLEQLCMFIDRNHYERDHDRNTVDVMSIKKLLLLATDTWHALPCPCVPLQNRNCGLCHESEQDNNNL